MPRVSVIIPTYNRALVLKKAIHSVLNQTYRDIEILVVDDGSIDQTGETIEALNPVRIIHPDKCLISNGASGALNQVGKRGRYFLSSPCFSTGHSNGVNRDKDRMIMPIYYIYQKNKGPAGARNRGINCATGELIAFLDSDDLWLKDKVSHQVILMDRDRDCRVCYTDEIWYRNGRRVNPRKRHKKHSGYLFSKSLELCIISPSSVMLRRDILDKVGLFDENLPVCEDYDMWLRITKDYPVFLVEEGPLIIKNGGHQDQLSKKYWGMDRFRIKAMLKLLNGDELDAEQRKQTIQMLRNKCEIYAQGCYKRGRRSEGDYYRDLAVNVKHRASY